MRSFEQYDETRKYFAEGAQRNNDANEVQKQLQLHDVSLGEYLTNKYALWPDFRTIDENFLHGTGRRIENALERITLQIEKKAESAGPLNSGDLRQGSSNSSVTNFVLGLSYIFQREQPSFEELLLVVLVILR